MNKLDFFLLVVAWPLFVGYFGGFGLSLPLLAVLNLFVVFTYLYFKWSK